MSKKQNNNQFDNQKPIRYYVFFAPPADEVQNAVQNNFVSYNSKLDGISMGGRKLASAKAHAIFAAAKYNGRIFVQYDESKELVAYKSER